MNPVPSNIGASRIAQVNLLPPEVAQRKAQGRLRVLLVFILLVFVALLVVAWVFAFGFRLAAEADLAAQQELTTQKQSELATYNYIPALEDQLQNSRDARGWAGVSDMKWSDHLTAISQAMPAGITFETMTVAPVSPIAPLSQGDLVFGGLDLGSISFQGDSEFPITAADLIDALEALPGFTQVKVDTVEIVNEEGKTFWSFAGSARLTTELLSGRTVTEQEIVAIEEEPGDTTDEGDE